MSKNKNWSKQRSPKEETVTKGDEYEPKTGQSKNGSTKNFKRGKGSTGKGRNPIETWNYNPNLTKLACSIPFSQSLGQPIRWNTNGGIAITPQLTTGDSAAPAMPGIMVLDTILAYGEAHDSSSSLNLAARNIWTFIRSLNSGAKNYNAAHMMLYFIAVDQAFALYSAAMRCYGTLLQYRILNRYTPSVVVEASGFDFASMYGNMAQFKFYLDQWATRLQSFVVPKSIKVFSRHFNDFANYYLDSDNIQKAQMYIMRPAKIFKWVEGTQSQTGAELTLAWDFRDGFYDSQLGTVSACVYYGDIDHMVSHKMTFTDLVQTMDDMLINIAASEDFNTIAGDLFKAYGLEGVWSIPTVPNDYQSIPVFNWEYLVQLHNATIFPGFKLEAATQQTGSELTLWNKLIDVDAAMGRVREIINGTENYLVQDIDVLSAGPCGSIGALLDVPFVDPSPEDVMEATRLTIGDGYSSETNLSFGASALNKLPCYLNSIVSVGTEVIVGAKMIANSFTISSTGDYTAANPQIGLLATVAPYDVTYTNWNDSWNGAFKQSEATYFTLAPVWYLWSNATARGYAKSGFNNKTYNNIAGISTARVQTLPIMNTYNAGDNCVLVSGETLSRMHTAAILSAFQIPHNAFSKQ